MGSSKVQLSQEEKILVANREWILTKHRVIDKVYALFGDLSEEMKGHLVLSMPFDGVAAEHTAKISKGERYQDMPWVTLDYPRFFSRANVLAIRSFFWWGHYFSITLHLKGEYFEASKENINAALAAGQLTGFYLSCGGDEFDFDLDGEAYELQGTQKSLPAACRASSFFKISQKLSLEDWEVAKVNLLRLFEFYTSLLKS